MNERWKWDDVKLFLSVARAGGLAGAVSETDSSAPTLGRRITALEQALGLKLFQRHRDGYDLTQSGTELLTHAEQMEGCALGIDRWLSRTDPRPTVRIAAGDWTSTFISRHLSRLTGDDENLAIELSTGVTMEDLMRREANIGIRNRRPDGTGLAGRKLSRIEFAVYGREAYTEADPHVFSDLRFIHCDWVAHIPKGPKTPSLTWLLQKLDRPPKVTCSTAQAVLETATNGSMLCVLPCFIGDTEPGLVRVSDTISDLAHDQWLVSHDDDRHLPHIRTVSRKLAALFKSHAAEFAGISHQKDPAGKS